MKTLKIIFAVVCLVAPFYAQTPGQSTLIRPVAILPTHCNETKGETVFLIGDGPYSCNAKDTWTKIGSGGGGVIADTVTNLNTLLTSEGQTGKATDQSKGQYWKSGGFVHPVSAEINVQDFGASPVDYLSQAGGTATGGTSLVTASSFPCTASQSGHQLWLAASGTAAADVTYSITGCSGSNYTVSPGVVTNVSAKAIAIGAQVDSSSAMSALLTYCTSMSGNTQKGCAVQFPGMGSYVFLSTIQISGYGPAIQKVRFVCSGNEGGTQLIWAGADQGALIKVGSSTANDFPSFEIKNCTLAGIDPTAHRPDGIYLFNAGTNTRIERNHFINTYHGVRITNSFYWVLEQNYFQGSSASCIYMDSSGGSPNSNSTISNNEMNQCGSAATTPDGWGVGDFSGAAEDTIRVINNDFEGNCCYNGMIRLLGSTPQIIGNRNEVTGNCIQDGTWRDLLLSGGVFGHAYAAGNEFFGGCGAVKGQYNVEVTAGTNHTFVGNLYGNSTVTPVRLGNSNLQRFWESLNVTDFTGVPDVIFGTAGTDSNKIVAQWPGGALHSFSGIVTAGQKNAAYLSINPFAGGGGALNLLNSNVSNYSGAMYPSAAGTNQTLAAGDFIWNSAYNYGPGAPRSQFPGWVARGTPVWNGSAWTGGTFDYLSASACLTVDSTAVPASGTWSTCDFVRNTNPSTGITGWLNTAGGTPGTWKTVYAIDATAPPAWGATTPNTGKFTNLTSTGVVDFSAATHTKPLIVGLIAAIPATCGVGEEYFATDATAGQNEYYCTATNTWTQEIISAGGSGITSLNGATGATQTFVNGTNIAVTTNTGTGAHTVGLSGTVGLANGGTASNANTGAAGKVLIGNGSGAFVEGDPLVQGLYADASASKANPVLLGGWDGTNLRAVHTDASGNFVVNFSAPQHVIIDSSASVAVTGPLTDTQLRASAVQVQSNSANIATETTIAAIKAKTDNIPAQGQALAAASLPVVLTAAQITTLTPPAAITNFANETGGNLAAIKTDVDKIPSQGQAAMVASMPVVIANNQSTIPVSLASAPTTPVTQADGADSTLGAKADAKSAATDTTAITVMQVLKEMSFLLQNKLLVTPDSVALPANQSVNISQINAVTPLMGNGNTGTGSPRVTVAADNTPFQVKILGAGGATTDAATAGGTTPTNGFSVLGGYQTTLPTLTNGQSADLPTDTHARPLVIPQLDTLSTSYHASAKFAASSTTDNAVLPGNATNTVLVTKVTVTCTETTAGQINVELLKRSAADTSGTAANMTVVPDDSSYTGGVSVPKSYTGTGPTVGTPVGDLDNAWIGCMAPGTATPNDVYVFKPAKPIVLRGTAQMIAVNVGNAALTGGSLTVTFDFTETTTP